MTDTAWIVAQAVAVVGPLAGVLLGYWLAGFRSEEQVQKRARERSAYLARKTDEAFDLWRDGRQL